jgi:phosphate transport system permease protein
LRARIHGISATPSSHASDARESRDALFDRGFRWLVAGAGLFVLAALVGAALSMAWGGAPAFKAFGWDFLFREEWGRAGQPVRRRGAGVRHAGDGGDRNADRGAGELRHRHLPSPRSRRPGCAPDRAAIELLAGIPSIIYGMWGLFVLSPILGDNVYPWVDEHMGQWPIVGKLFAGPPLGIGMFTAGLVLAIMVIPFIIR